MVSWILFSGHHPQIATCQRTALCDWKTLCFFFVTKRIGQYVCLRSLFPSAPLCFIKLAHSVKLAHSLKSLPRVGWNQWICFHAVNAIHRNERDCWPHWKHAHWLLMVGFISRLRWMRLKMFLPSLTCEQINLTRSSQLSFFLLLFYRFYGE